jgi:hypothetical protein
VVVSPRTTHRPPTLEEGVKKSLLSARRGSAACCFENGPETPTPVSRRGTPCPPGGEGCGPNFHASRWTQSIANCAESLRLFRQAAEPKKSLVLSLVCGRAQPLRTARGTAAIFSHLRRGYLDRLAPDGSGRLLQGRISSGAPIRPAAQSLRAGREFHPRLFTMFRFAERKQSAQEVE